MIDPKYKKWPEEQESVEEPEWRRYEKQIAENLRKKATPNAKVDFDVRIPGRISGVQRQVDVRVTGDFGGIVGNVTAVVDCKAYARPVDVKVVEAFMGLLDDVKAELGIIYTTVGFTDAARSRVAARPGIHLHTEALAALVVRDEEQLEWIEYWTPVSEDGEYEGDFFDFTPYGEEGARITYSRPNGDDWRVVYAAPDLNWGDPGENRLAAKVLLGDYLGREPTDAEVQSLAVGAPWEEGFPWELSVADLVKLGFHRDDPSF